MTTTISYYNHSTEEQPETNNILLFASANPVKEAQIVGLNHGFLIERIG